jgi:4-hydroxy-3-methylbut-2-enyl diphosphate reductase
MVKKIILSKPYGFCFGVKNALQIVDEVLAKYPGERIYVYNEIVHNKTIVEALAKKNVVFTKDISIIPDKAVVIFSAHGVPPQIRIKLAKKQAVIYDATCHLVQKVHDEVNKYSAQGYHVIYIGSKSHDEAIGVIAENPGNISIVETAEDIKNIKTGFKKYIVLTQTTLNMFEVEKLFERIKQKIPQVEFPDKKDLCYTTTSRQQAVTKNAQKCDLLLVVGSKNSSNSKKLKEIAAQYCPAHLIDNTQEIVPAWLKNAETICLTSGASAPDHLIDDIINVLKSNYGFSLSDE